MAMGGRRGRGGRVSVARLRRWLLTGVVVLVAALIGIVGYARYRARKFVTGLPHRLGIDVKSETNGYTYSQSVKGRTLFTLHAAKAIQRENGKTTLHDVSIIVYGPAGSNRQDSIKGAEFEYDQPNSVIRAAGEVHLDLASPSQTAAAKPDAKRIAVTTSGLVFLQKLGIAATDDPIHFTYGDIQGEARGADYDSDTGTLRLHSAVHAAGTQNGQAIDLVAAAAEVDRNSRVATLHSAHLKSDGNVAAGDTVVVTTARDGGIQNINAQGHASVEGKEGVKAQAPHMDVAMTTEGKPQVVHMTGGVQLQNENGTGSSGEATLHLNAKGLPEQADLLHGVKLGQSNSSGGNDTLTADHVVAALAQDGGRRTQLRDAVATGGAVLRSVSTMTAAGKQPQTKTTVIHADALHAITAPVAGVAGARAIAELDGNGNTRVEEDDGAGTTRTSSGDTLQAKLAPAAKSKPGARNQAATSQLQTAVQTGHVVVTQHTAAVAGKAAEDSRATASRADYDQSTGRMVLTGSPIVTGNGFQLAATRVSMVQGSGDAEAEGGVSGTFIQAAPEGGRQGDPIHVLADHANISNNGAVGKFYGGAKAARMWTPTAQMDAPVIETERATGKLTAHAAAAASAASQVHLTLPMAAAKASPKAAADSGAPMRITSSGLVYTPADAAHAAHADLSGGVRMESASAVLTANSAVATLSGGAANAPKQTGVLAGNIEAVTATGNVHMQQPGRTGTGEKLVYTAADSRYELTGTPAALPKISDSLQGNITGVMLVFHGNDDSVEVSGDSTHRVHTETQLNKGAAETGRSRPGKGR